MPNSESSNTRLEALAGRLKSVLTDELAPLAVIRFDLGADGCLMLDARRTPPTVNTGSGPADCTLSMRLDTLERVLTGGLDGTVAFMQGEMTISGDVELAVRLNEVLAHAVADVGDSAPPG